MANESATNQFSVGDPRSDDELLVVLQAFVMRARRVLSHSLCSDYAALEALADGAMTVRRRDGVESIRWTLPNEESLESLAVRVRPLIIHDDGLHYTAVLKALSAWLHRHGQARDVSWCRALKKDWQSVDPKGSSSGYWVSTAPAAAPEAVRRATDVQLADTWFYGDLVHADPEQIANGAAFGINKRFIAATIRTAQLAVLTRDTLSFIRLLADDDVIALDMEALDAEPVTFESRNLEGLQIWSAAAGTPVAPDLGSAGEEWSNGLPGVADGIWTMRVPWGWDG